MKNDFNISDWNIGNTEKEDVEFESFFGSESKLKLNDKLKISFCLDNQHFEGEGQIININGNNYEVKGKGILEKL